MLESDDVRRLFPIITEAERLIADPIVRNHGTIGGSLCPVVFVSGQQHLVRFNAVLRAVFDGRLDPARRRGDPNAPPAIGSETRAEAFMFSPHRTRLNRQLALRDPEVHRAVISGKAQETRGQGTTQAMVTLVLVETDGVTQGTAPHRPRRRPSTQ